MVTPNLNEPTSDDKLWAGLSYTGMICCLIPTLVIFFLKKDESAYIKFNALQAIGVGVGMIILTAIFLVLQQIPFLGFFVGLANLLFDLVALAGWIYLMIQAFTGKEAKIPVLAELIEQNLMG